MSSNLEPQQDTIYLEEYVKVKLEAIIKSGDTVSSKELRDFTNAAKLGLDDAAQFQDDCIRKLGVPLNVMLNEWKTRSKQLQNSVEFYMSVADGTLPVDTTARPWVECVLRVHSTFSILIHQ